METIIEDTRNQIGKHKNINEQLEKLGYKVTRCKLLVGDYTFATNQSICIDTKKDILEICQNVCQSHERFINEIQRANESGIKLVFLIENEDGIESLKDLPKWKNPRRFYSKRATTGKMLYGILNTIQDKYNTKFYFCNHSETGAKIVELLEKGELKC